MSIDGSCWKCGTPWLDSPDFGPFCPSKTCDVVDAVLLSPEEFTHREKWGRAFTFYPIAGPPVRFGFDGRPITEEKMSELPRRPFGGPPCDTIADGDDS